jgi:Ca2+-binding EF-hand superfamily protein
MKAAVDDKFRQLDANGDGTISQEESTKMKGLTERFQAADKNKDGKLDRGEFGLAMGG